MGKYYLDLCGEVCPINWIKTKLKLEELEAGGILEIKIDSVEGIANVPRSAKEEGHKILYVKEEKNYYKIGIEKGK